MTLYRYVHLSDIHFGQERYGDKPVHNDVRVELLRDCARLHDSYGNANGVLVSGDVAFSGKTDQYRSAGEWLDKLTNAIGCTDTAVSVVPGNHDVDVSQIGPVMDIVHEKLRTTPLTNLDALLGSIEHDPNNALLPKLATYQEFAERYGCDFPVWEKELRLEDPNKLRFVGMTSVIVSNLIDAENTMILGNHQYIINRTDCTELVVMLHHPLHWFRNHEIVEKYLNRAKVIFVGHEHNPKVRLIRHEAGETLWIHAGATNPPGDTGQYTYRYNWVEFEHIVKNGELIIRVKVQPRLWNSYRTKFDIDHGLLKEGDEFMVHDLACPGFKMPAPKPVSAIPIVPKVEKEEQVVDVVRESMNQDNNSFVRLRYLFWKHLDWSERLKVLVELDILPPNLNQPLPQTMERLALENANKAGKLKLKAIWDAIMARVPEDQRESNPF
jgi:metallophosphoesterase superfamily enzyme